MTVATPPAAGPISTLAGLLAVRRRWAAAFGTLALLAVSVLQRLDLALSAAHPAGAVAGGVGDIASPFRIGSGQQGVAVARGWVQYQAELPPGARSVRWMTVGYLAGDLVLMSAITLLLALWWARAVRAAAALDQPSPRQAALSTAVRWTGLPLLAYLPADLIETVLATGQWSALDLPFARAIAIASLVKWMALVLVAVPLLAAELLGLSPVVRRVLRALRGQLLIAGLLAAVLLALVGELGLQVDDLLIRSAEDRSGLVAGSACALICGVFLYGGGRMRVKAYINAPLARPIHGFVVVVLGAAGLAGLAAGVAVPLTYPAQARYAGSWHVVALVGGLLVAYALTSLPKQVRRYQDAYALEVGSSPGEVVQQARSWLALLGAVPPVALALAVTRAATSQAASGGHAGTTLVMAAWVCALLTLTALCLRALGYWSAHLVGPTTDPSWAWASGSLLLGAGGLLLMAFPIGQQQGQRAGAAAMLFIFCTLLATATTGLVALGDLMPARGSLAVLGFRRTPFIGLAVLLVAGASLVDRDGVYFDAVTAQDRQLATPAGLTIPLVDPGDAFTAWLAAQPATAGPVPGGRPVTSLVFVAAAGGGIKAAYWTAAGMSCAIGSTCGSGKDRTGSVFLASGVSGGSLGLAAVRAHQETWGPGRHRGGRADGESGWYDRALGRDFVSPSIGAFLFRDLPNSVLRLPWSGYNRASSLQDAWQTGLPALGRPFYRTDPAGTGRFPYLVLNGASVEDGCRLAVSELRLAPGPGPDARPGPCAGDDADPRFEQGPRAYPVRNAADYLCDRVLGSAAVPEVDRRAAHNIRLSTAALLSARFPYVSPSGDLSRCGSMPLDAGDATDPRRRQYSTEHTYVVDGGLFDNSGATAVSQVWESIAAVVQKGNVHPQSPGQPCVVPRLLVLDNHYDAQEAPSTAQRPQQLTAPPSAKNRVYDLRSTLPLARAEAAIRTGAADALAACGVEDPVATADQSVVVLHPVQRPGSKAPLGWTLSRWSREDMAEQLHSPRNRCRVATVRAWFGEGRARSDCETLGTARIAPSEPF